MNAIPDPKQATPNEVAVAAIKQAYEQIGRREQQLARVNEQVSELEPDATLHPSDPQQAYEEQLARVDEQASKLEQDGAPHPSDPQHAFKQEQDAARHRRIIRRGLQLPSGASVGCSAGRRYAPSSL